ncbi:MAG: hypothetical protein BWY83_02336 [bacterium ADurb.Bin478]|nr:MAG: hypothetical protein BWY83_02336 [bacterium ADurb.Bin478]
MLNRHQLGIRQPLRIEGGHVFGNLLPFKIVGESLLLRNDQQVKTEQLHDLAVIILQRFHARGGLLFFFRQNPRRLLIQHNQCEQDTGQNSDGQDDRYQAGKKINPAMPYLFDHQSTDAHQDGPRFRFIKSMETINSNRRAAIARIAKLRYSESAGTEEGRTSA